MLKEKSGRRSGSAVVRIAGNPTTSHYGGLTSASTTMRARRRVTLVRLASLVVLALIIVFLFSFFGAHVSSNGNAGGGLPPHPAVDGNSVPEASNPKEGGAARFRESMRSVIADIIRREGNVVDGAAEGTAKTAEMEAKREDRSTTRNRRDQQNPLIVMCACGYSGFHPLVNERGVQVNTAPPTSPQTICENIVRSSLLDVPRGAVLANHYYPTFGMDVNSLVVGYETEANKGRDGGVVVPQSQANDVGLSSHDHTTERPFVHPMNVSSAFWGFTSQALRDSISAHAIKMSELSLKRRRDGRVILTLPPLKAAKNEDGPVEEDTDGLFNHNNDNRRTANKNEEEVLLAKSIHKYFGVVSSSRRRRLSSSSSAQSLSMTGQSPPQQCYLPSFETLLRDALADVRNSTVMKERSEAKSIGEASEGGGGGGNSNTGNRQHLLFVDRFDSLLSARQRSTYALHYDYAIVCPRFATAALLNATKTTRGARLLHERKSSAYASSLFVKRLLLQSQVTYLVDDDDDEVRYGGSSPVAKDSDEDGSREIVGFFDENAWELKEFNKGEGEKKRKQLRRRRGPRMIDGDDGDINGEVNKEEEKDGGNKANKGLLPPLPLLKCEAEEIVSEKSWPVRYSGCWGTAHPDDADRGNNKRRNNNVGSSAVNCFSTQRGADVRTYAANKMASGGNGEEETLQRQQPPSWRLPRICGHIRQPERGLTIQKVIKFGTKTGIYAAVYPSSSLSVSSSSSREDASTGAPSAGGVYVVKHFAALQYAQFTGFQAFMRWLPSGFSFYSPSGVRTDLNNADEKKKGRGLEGGEDGDHQSPLPLIQSRMYPLIIAPEQVCYDDASNTVIQLQYYAKEAVNLKKLMKKEGKMMGMAGRLQIAIQIVCIFDFLHTKHPSGRVFTFDDNHPEQYIVTKHKQYVTPQWMRRSKEGKERSRQEGESVSASPLRREEEEGNSNAIHGKSGELLGSPFYEVKLIDIDTLQLSVPGHNPTGKVNKTGNYYSNPKDEGKESLLLNSTSRLLTTTNLTTKCRCFFCKGRSNCMFVNTLEGYAGCGQTADNEASGDNEAAAHPPTPPTPAGSRSKRSSINSGSERLCNPSSDIWFLAQLLFYIGDGGRVPFEGLSMADVIRRLTAAAALSSASSAVGPSLSQLSNLYPRSRTEDDDYNDLVVLMFHYRPSTSAILRKLFELCAKHKCGFDSHQCPAVPMRTPTSAHQHQPADTNSLDAFYDDIVDRA